MGIAWEMAHGYTVTTLCNNCFHYQENCLYIKLSLLRETTAVRMRCSVLNYIVPALSVLTSSVLTKKLR